MTDVSVFCPPDESIANIYMSKNDMILNGDNYII